MRSSTRSPRGSSSRRGALQVTSVFERFTERAIKGVLLAQQEAKVLGCLEVCTEHLLLGLIAEDQGKGGTSYLGSENLTLEKTRAAVQEIAGPASRRAEGRAQEIGFSRESKQVFEAAMMESRRMGMNFLSPEHILVALLSVGNSNAKRVVERLAGGSDTVKQEALKRLKGEQDNEGEGATKKRPAMAAASVSPGGAAGRAGSKALDAFTRDLCQQARQAKTDPIFGREKEVARVIQILARRRKNNPVLLGEPGVGKTAIAEGLAHAIVNGQNPDGSPLPPFLVNKRIMQLDVGLLMAGAKERGELEKRITTLLQEVQAHGDVVLMVDEIHTLVGAGSVGRGGGGGLDMANMLKPALARGELQCIGATTLDEFRKYFEKDAALERRFQPVLIDEPDTEQALVILEGLKRRYEEHHRCAYDAGALAAAVHLSNRYIPDRFLPDKAIDLMDEAGSRARIAAFTQRRRQAKWELLRQDVNGPGDASKSGASSRSSSDWDGEAVRERAGSWEELRQVMIAKEEAAKEGLFEEATLLRQREVGLKRRLAGSAGSAAVVPQVTAADVAAIVAQWTGIPLEQMSRDDMARLVQLDQALKAQVVGQDEAVGAIARAVRRAGSGLKDPQRPIAAMLFSGPTGVGKTELTKVLARQYFGSGGALVRLDMSEYMERHSVSKLVGAPPGYIGFGEGGKLTEAVRRRPHSVVLLDEVEKAHPDVFNMLLQIMEDGRLTDSQGRVVSFKDTLLVMTSNIGSNVIAKGATQLGFSLPGDDADGGRYSRIRALVMEELKAYFRPELLNRLDEVVVFKPLGRAEVKVIADIVLAESLARIEERGIAVKLTPALVDKVLAEGYDEAYGARPLKRAVTHIIDDPVSEAILFGRLQSGDAAVLDVDAKGEVLVLVNGEKAPVAQDTKRGLDIIGIDGKVVSTDGDVPSSVNVSAWD